jgi:hypothetical protein
VILLGPQGGTPDVGAALAEYGIRGKVALVRAGYQEREAEDGPMIASLGLPAVNLALHARGVELFRADTEFTTAYKERQQRLRNMQALYRIRIEKTEDAEHAISVRYVDPELLAMEEKVSVDQFRYLDVDHIERCKGVREQFDAKWTPGERPLIAQQRAEVRAALAECNALVIAGGHIASLLNRLHLFDVIAAAAGKPIVAWSAGAMALTDRVVLFHDYPPYGSDIAQVLDAGYGLAPGIVVLPDPKRRLKMDAHAGIQRFARRMAPATCVAMDHGARVVFSGPKIVRALGTRLTTQGVVEMGWIGTPSRFSSPSMRGVKP